MYHKTFKILTLGFSMYFAYRGNHLLQSNQIGIKMCRKANFLKTINTCYSSMCNIKNYLEKTIFCNFSIILRQIGLVIRKFFGFNFRVISDAIIVYSFNSMLNLYLQLARHDYPEPRKTFSKMFLRSDVQ